MNRKELNKTVVMISNWKNPFGLQGFYKKILRYNGQRQYDMRSYDIQTCAVLVA